MFSTADGGNTHTAKIDEETRSGFDYGMIIKCTNPYSRNKKLIILYGAYDWGTLGATRFVLNNNDLKQLKKLRDNIWVLVEATIIDGRIAKIDLRDQDPFHFME